MISASLREAGLLETPFPHLVATEGLAPSYASLLLMWLESDAPWNLVEETFYEQYEFSLCDAILPESASDLISDSTLETLRNLVQSKFTTKLSDRVDVTAHKLIAGQRIRIHNDFIDGQETHRILIQLNRGWSDDNGGLLMLFGSDNASDLQRVFRPVHNSCVAFEISPKSHHAVSAIHDGERFTLVYSFFARS